MSDPQIGDGPLLAFRPKPENKTLNEVISIAEDAVAEALKTMKDWPPFNSAHEGFRVMKEEVDELWDHVKTNQKKRCLLSMRKEAIQVAAMAIRFAVEVCNEKTGRV